MTKKTINKNALAFLKKQNWQKAQQLLFYNSKKNPSHQTYNNLGYYLITEGLLIKSGRTRNAFELGKKYLMKAYELERTVVNINALVKMIEFQSLSASIEEKIYLHSSARNLLKEAIQIKYSDVLQYNLLRFEYFLNPGDKYLFPQTVDLLQNYACPESALLLLGILWEKNFYDEGVKYIGQYGHLIDKIDLLMSYSKLGLYKEGCELSESIIPFYDLDDFVLSAIIECYVNTQHFSEAKKLLLVVKDRKKESNDQEKNNFFDVIFENLSSSDIRRRNKINNYFINPPFIDSCCYFGCELHQTDWEIMKD